MNPNRIVRAALIGCGSYGAEHAKFLSTYAGVRLHAVADIAAERATAFAQQFGAGYATADVGRIWSDPEIDAVWICTQHHTHAPLAEAAAAAGKAFFLEKPLALTLADCDRIVAAVERSAVLAASGFKLRFFPAVVAAKLFLTKPTLTTAHVIDDHWPSEFWANDPVQGGGNVLSQGCHIVDTVLHLHPTMPVRVYAAGGNRHHPTRDIVDTAALILTFADGAVANIAVGDVGVPPHASKFALQQSDGMRSFSLYNRLNSLMTRQDKTITEHPAWVEAGAAVIDTPFIAAVAAGGPSPVTVQSARRTTAVVLAAIESIKTGRAVDLTAAPYAAAGFGPGKPRDDRAAESH
ncbi:MAG: Gfo/Idh/MocA family protein [Opitutales bacterium]